MYHNILLLGRLLGSVDPQTHVQGRRNETGLIKSWWNIWRSYVSFCDMWILKGTATLNHFCRVNGGILSVLDSSQVRVPYGIHCSQSKTFRSRYNKPNGNLPSGDINSWRNVMQFSAFQGIFKKEEKHWFPLVSHSQCVYWNSWLVWAKNN